MDQAISRAAQSNNLEGRSSKPLALIGWPLAFAIVLDKATGGGFLRASCYARQAWRQAFIAALAGGLLDHPGLFLERALGQPTSQMSWQQQLSEVAALLPVMKAREIVQAGLGACPAGFLGALSKLRYEPLPPRAYLRLLDIYSSQSGADRQRRRVLTQLTFLDRNLIEVLDALDPIFLHPVVVGRVRSKEQAATLNSMLEAIRLSCSTATDDALRDSLSGFTIGGTSAWAKKWLNKADATSTSMVLSDPELVVITPSNAGHFADKFSNCLKSLKGRMILGTWVAVAFEASGLVLTFAKLTDRRWLLNGMFARGNGTVSAEQRRQARQKVAAMGDGFVMPEEVPVELQAVSELINPFWLHDLEDLE